MITITADHLALLAHLRFDWDDECEWGAVSSDPKRPFGNSDVPGDVSEILGRDVDYDEARRLTIELASLVQLAVHFAAKSPDAVGLAEGVRLSPSGRTARHLGPA